MANVAKETIIDALNQLDPNNPEHWTDDGLPVTKVVQGFAGDESIKRSDITDVAPGFARDTLQAQSDETGSVSETDPVTGVLISADNAENDGAILRPQLEDDFSQKVAAVEALQKEIHARQTDLVKAVRAKDAALLLLHAKFPPMSAAENIQHYLESEARKRHEAAGVPFASTLDRVLSHRKSPLGYTSNVRQRGRIDPRAAAAAMAAAAVKA